MDSTARVISIDGAPANHNNIAILWDRPYYLPGQKIQGQVRIDLKKQTEIQSLSVALQGVENTHSFVYGKGPSAGSFNSSRPMSNVGFWLSQKATLPAGSTLFPFAFDIPSECLPSYTGKHANVTWKISSKASIGWGKDLETGIPVIVANTSRSPSVPLAVENQETQPRVRLSLPSNVYLPGTMINGRLLLLEPGNMRAVRLQLQITEYATAQGTHQNRDTTEVMPMGDQLVFNRNDLISTREVPFQMPLSAQVPCSYIGSFSRIIWSISGTVDIPHGGDVDFNLPFQVGLRSIPMVEGGSGQVPPIAEPLVH